MIVLAAIRTSDGKIHTDKCHAYIMWSLPKGTNFEDQGFVDENGKFYNRYEAAEEAIRCGQITKMRYPSMGLDSSEICANTITPEDVQRANEIRIRIHGK